MKQKLLIVLCLLVLVIGSNFLRSGSSYSTFVREEKSSEDYTNQGDSSDHSEKRSSEDIALDKRLDEERKRNEISYKTKGIAGTSIISEGNEPTFDLNELINVFGVLHLYMEEHPEELPAPDDDLGIRRTPDPRINQNLYAEEKKGIIEGFESENLIAMELKKLDGNYTIIILGKDSADGEWRVLSEGDVYKLREEITNGN